MLRQEQLLKRLLIKIQLLTIFAFHRRRTLSHL